MTTSPIRPKVSVLVLTYDHEKYIRQALESALLQKTAWEYEVVVAEDCSRDRTAQLVREVSEINPGRIRILMRERNLGLVRNFCDAYAACRGEYVAILEGDDFWQDSEKLQRMVEVLDEDPRLSFAFHDVRLSFDDGRELNECCPSTLKSRFAIEDFIAHNPVPNCSALVFRHGLINEFPTWFSRQSYYDWPLHVLHLERGPAAYLREALSTYRVHKGGAWHGASSAYRVEKLAEIFRALNEHLDFRYNSVFELNEKFWRVQFENEDLLKKLADAGDLRLQLEEFEQVRQKLSEVESDRRRLQEIDRRNAEVLRSRSYRMARAFSGLQTKMSGLLRLNFR